MRGKEERGGHLQGKNTKREEEEREVPRPDDDEEEGVRPHGRLTHVHARDLADVPRGQVLVEDFGRAKHWRGGGGDQSERRGREREGDQ